MLPERNPSTHLKYRSDIDGLRAIAVLSVVGFHAFPEWVKGGFVGVDIFFVISGYLISTIIFQGLERGDFSYADFYARRIKRIFPALITVLLTSLAFGWLVLTGDEYRQLGRHAIAGAGFVSNFMVWNESGYFDNREETKPLLHLWSLGIEEQFYILWPLLLGWSFRRKWNLLRLTIVIAVASFAWNIYSMTGDPVGAFYSPLSRFWELMLGGILAYLTLHKSRYLPQKPQWQSTLGLILIALSITLLNKERAFPGWWALAPDAGALLVISAGPRAWLNRWLLSNPLLVWIGLISYPLYLWHWPLLSFARIMGSQVPPDGIRIVLVLVSLRLASWTYNSVEKPIRLEKGNLIVTSGLCLFMVGIVYFGYWASVQPTNTDIVLNTIFLHQSGESPADAKDIYAPALKKYAEILKAEPDYVARLKKDRWTATRSPYCHLFYQPFEQYKLGIGTCVTLSSPRKNILIIGDSHAADLYMALVHTNKQFNFLQLTGVKCTPIRRSYQDAKNRCAELLEYAVSFTRKHRLDAVILEAWWDENYEDLAFDIAKLKAEGQKVILVGPPLEYSADVPMIIARRRNGVSFRAYMDSFIVKRSIATSNNMRTFAQSNGISFIDRIQYFCENGCPVMNSDGQLFVWDYAHLSVFGGMFLGNQFLRDNALQRIIDSPVPLRLPVP